MAIAHSFNQQATLFHANMRLARLLRRLRLGPLFRWRFTGFSPQTIYLTPLDLHLADASLAHEFYHGRFELAGKVVQAGAISPFLINPPSPQWEEALHDFSWLRHMEAAQNGVASAHARSLLSDWIDHTHPLGGNPWKSRIVSKRIINWLCHNEMLLKNATPDFARKFLRALGLQIRYQRAIVNGTENNENRLHGHIALAFGAICLDMSAKQKKHIFSQLEQCLAKQILPDGGHISRNPAVLFDLLTDLISLRHAFAQRGHAIPRLLNDSIERMLPALRFFRHGDGSLARFNGAYPIAPQRMDYLLELDDTLGAPFSYAPHSGYHRLSAGHTTIIADTGKIAPYDASSHMHAGCLSFEMSSGQQSFIVNCGTDPYAKPDYVLFGRTTAAHSTATLNDTSSCRFAIEKRKQRQRAIYDGPTKNKVERIEGPERIGFVANHNGYKKAFNLVHERGILLNTNGNIIDGYDRFFAPNKGKADGRDQMVLRFHLHPDIDVSFDNSGSLRLEAPGKEAWRFSCPDAPLQLDDSVFFAGLNGPQKTRQIIIHVRPSLTPKIRWRMVRVAKTKNK